MRSNVGSAVVGLFGIAVAAALAAVPPARAETEVSGPIADNTVWESAGSPYTLTAPVTVESGFTLTIMTGVQVNVEQDFTIDGTVSSADARFDYARDRDIVVNGRLVATGATFDGLRDFYNQESLVFNPGSQGALTDCSITDLTVRAYTSNLTIHGGSVANGNPKSHAKSVNIEVTSGASPVLTGVDFSAQADWLYVTSLPWFVEQVQPGGSLLANVTANTYAAEAVVTVGSGSIAADFEWPAGAFAASGLYRWAGGQVDAEATVSVPKGVMLEMRDDGVTVDGAWIVQDGAQAKCLRTVEVPGSFTIEGGGLATFSGASTQLNVSGAFALATGAQANLNCAVTVSGTMTVGNGATVNIETLTATGPGAALIASSGATLNINADGIIVQQDALVSATGGAIFNLMNHGDLQVMGSGNLTASGCTFAATTPGCDLAIHGTFDLGNCTFNGYPHPDNNEDLAFENGSSGTLHDCTIHDFNLRLASPVSLTGGLVENSDGPAVHLAMTSGPAPTITGVDFSADPQWMYIAHTSWFADQYEDSLQTAISGNAYAPEMTIRIGPGPVDAELDLSPTGAFGGAYVSQWIWDAGPAGALTIEAGGALALAPTVRLDVIGQLSILGELYLESGNTVSLGETTHVAGSLRAYDLELLTLANTTSVAPGGLLELATAARKANSHANTVRMDTGSSLVVEGELAAIDTTFDVDEYCLLSVPGAAQINNCLLDLNKGADLHLAGPFDAIDTVFDGHGFPSNLETIVFEAGCDVELTRCQLLHFNCEVYGDLVIRYSRIENGYGDGLLVAGDATLELDRCNLLAFLTHAIHSAAIQTVPARNCYWGAADGPSGRGPGSGASIEWTAESGGIDYEPYRDAACNLGLVHALHHAPSGVVMEPVAHVEVTFDAEIDHHSFDAADVAVSGPGAAASVTGIVDLGGNVWRVAFDAQSAPGDYHVLVGPDILSFAGLAMDQNLNGIPAEDLLDAYDAHFSIRYPPQAAFSADTTEGCAPIDVAFTDASQFEPTQWFWDFGDGETSTEQHPTHRYVERGAHTVSLEVRNAYGQDFETKTNYILLGKRPLAAFYAAPTSGPAPLTVTCTDLSSEVPTQWLWDFGNGDTSTEPSPDYTYEQPGTFTVSLRVENECGFDLIEQVDLVAVREPDLPPVAPEWVDASDGTTCNTILVRWQDVEDATTYDLYRDDAPVASDQTLTRYDDTTAAPGVTYAYKIVAKNAFGSSPPSAPDDGYWIDAPAAPATVTASQGAFEDKVRVEWTSVDGATGYRIYRNTTDDFETAIEIAQAGDADNAFDDANATKPTVTTSTGCGGGTTTEFHYVLYWVVAENLCGLSEPAGPHQGYVGTAAKSSQAPTTVYEKVLPAQACDDGVRCAGPDSQLAVRLRSDAPIDVATVWGVIQSADRQTDAVHWSPLEGAAHDGWVVHVPDAPWTKGDLVTFTVGAATNTGEPIGPLAYTFAIGAAPTPGSTQALWQPGYEDFDPSELEETAQSADFLTVAERQTPGKLPDLAQGIGPAYRLGPEGVYPLPQRVWLPAPDGANTNALAVYYYYGGDEDCGWYRAENVEGWLASHDYWQLELDGVTYLGFLVHHSGNLVRLAWAPTNQPVVSESAAVIPTGVLFSGAIGDLLTLALVGLVLFCVGKRTRPTPLRVPTPPSQ